MTPEQLVLLSPVFIALLNGLRCYRGTFWDVIRSALFTFIALTLALQHLDLSIGVMTSIIGPQFSARLIQGLVFSGTTVVKYAGLLLLYRQLWQSQPRSSHSGGGLRLIYGFTGIGIGWLFGATLLHGLLVSDSALGSRHIPPYYLDAVRQTANIVIDNVVIFFIP